MLSGKERLVEMILQPLEISGSDDQWLLDPAFDTHSSWQWIRLPERVGERIVMCEAKRWRRPVCPCLEERMRNTRI